MNATQDAEHLAALPTQLKTMKWRGSAAPEVENQALMMIQDITLV